MQRQGRRDDRELSNKGVAPLTNFPSWLAAESWPCFAWCRAARAIRSGVPRRAPRRPGAGSPRGPVASFGTSRTGARTRGRPRRRPLELLPAACRSALRRIGHAHALPCELRREASPQLDLLVLQARWCVARSQDRCRCCSSSPRSRDRNWTRNRR